MRSHARAMVGMMTLLTLVLSGCSVQAPGKESLETAIPKAFLASDLPITGAQAGSGVDGFAVNVWASAEFETGTVTADDLRTMLKLAVENTGLSKVNTLEILATEGPYKDDRYIDLGSVGAELGFDDDDELSSFSAPWEDVVAFLDK
jgi:hypothetical protein